MDGAPPGIRRMCIAVAAGAPAGSDAAGAHRALARASAALGNACRSAGLDRVLVDTELARRGHAAGTEVALLPAGIDEPRAVAALISSLAGELRRANGGCGGEGRVRLRLAVHEGVTILTAGGFAGRAVDWARRLASAPPLRAAFDAHPGADLIVLLSGQVYDDVTQFGDAGLPRGRFRRAEMTSAAGGHRDTAWIYVPLAAGL
jgi:hypothetical protein